MCNNTSKYFSYFFDSHLIYVTIVTVIYFQILRYYFKLGPVSKENDMYENPAGKCVKYILEKVKVVKVESSVISSRLKFF